MIGNAVPPLLAIEIGRLLLPYLAGRNQTTDAAGTVATPEVLLSAA
jgi:hypothetical protein